MKDALERIPLVLPGASLQAMESELTSFGHFFVRLRRAEARQLIRIVKRLRMAKSGPKLLRPWFAFCFGWSGFWALWKGPWVADLYDFEIIHGARIELDRYVDGFAIVKVARH
jgi:hypothetical protein